jgi:hypothetical protein
VIDVRGYGELGLSEALERLEERLAVPVPGYEMALTDYLHWAHVLHELHKKRLGGGDDEAFARRNDLTPGGRVLRALMWVKDFPIHQLVSVTNEDLTASGLIGTGITRWYAMGGGAGPAIWSSQAGFKEEPGHEHPKERALYVQLVEGRSALDPLEEAANYLLGLPDPI